MSNRANLITVVIPLYNAEKYVAQTLESVFSQTHKELEVIIVDDGSTDNGRAICEKFKKKYDNLIISNQKNSGVAVARNRGLNKASGEFVIFLDADDFFAKDALTSMLKCQRETGAEFVIGTYDCVGEDGEMKQKRNYKFPNTINSQPDYLFMDREETLMFTADFENYPASNYIMGFCWGRLFKTSILRENSLQFNEKAWFADDSIFTLDYVSLVNKMAILKSTALFYREYDQAVSISARITEGEPILRDGQLFFDAAVKFMVNNSICDLKKAQNRTAWKIVGNIIIKMIKSTKDLNRDNQAAVLNEISTIVKSQFTQKLLKSYRPKPGNSWLLPLLMRLRLPKLVLLICHKRAKKRYLAPKTKI